MKQKRLKNILLTISLACVLAIVSATAFPAVARQETVNSPGSNGTLPVTFTLGSLMDAHEQDIKERMFEYKYEAASGDTAAQIKLLKERNDELKSNTATKNGILLSLRKNYDTAFGGNLTALTDEMGVSIENLNGMSNMLLDHAMELSTLNGDDTFKDTLRALIDEIKNTRKLALEASKAAKDKGNPGNNGNSGNNDSPGKNK